MPLVQIHIFKNVWSPEEIRSLADTIQTVMESDFNAPPRDRYQIITQHEPYEMICQETNLPNLERTNKLVFLHIFQQGRSKDVKQKAYAAFMSALKEKFGLGNGDLIISLTSNQPEDWSFGAGRAQFLTGEL